MPLSPVGLFGRVPGTIKTDYKIFFRKFLDSGGKYLSFEGIQNVPFTDIVPKRRPIELDNNIHKANIVWNREKNKGEA